MTQSRKQQTSIRSAMIMLSTLCLTVGSAGCHSSHQGFKYAHCFDSHIARKRASIQAWYVWMQCRDQCGCDRPRDYRRGFIEGYCKVAMGGDACTPVVPSARYWGWRYQNEDGGACVAAWYEGYPMGAAAATQVGANYQIQTIVPNNAEYEEFKNDFYNSYDGANRAQPANGNFTPAVTPESPETDYEAELPAAPALNPDSLDSQTQDFIDAPVAPSVDRARFNAAEVSFDEEDLLDSLDALERETLNRVPR